MLSGLWPSIHGPLQGKAQTYGWDFELRVALGPIFIYILKGQTTCCPPLFFEKYTLATVHLLRQMTCCLQTQIPTTQRWPQNWGSASFVQKIQLLNHFNPKKHLINTFKTLINQYINSKYLERVKKHEIKSS